MAQDQKQAAIIEAAIKRFAHFGVAKTTMAEIATDLSLSKASLYYYFPDKLNLFAEVLTSIVENAENVDPAVYDTTTPIDAILLFLERRTEFIIKYHNILEFLKTFNENNMPPELEPVFSRFKRVELKRISTIMEKGITTGAVKSMDVKKTAELYYDFLDGFRLAIRSRSPNFFPDKKQFQAILKKEKEFSVIFFRGLSF